MDRDFSVQAVQAVNVQLLFQRAVIDRPHFRLLDLFQPVLHGTKFRLDALELRPVIVHRQISPAQKVMARAGALP